MVKGIVDKLFEFFLTPKEFTFRFDEYDGSEQSLQIYDGQVIEYEFINAGTTVCIIGGGLKLYPTISGLIPNRVKLAVNYNERDVTVYPYKFIPLDLTVISNNSKLNNIFATTVRQDLVVEVTNINTRLAEKDEQKFNRLIVISKVKAKSVPKSVEPHGKKNKTQKFR